MIHRTRSLESGVESPPGRRWKPITDKVAQWAAPVRSVAPMTGELEATFNVHTYLVRGGRLSDKRFQKAKILPCLYVFPTSLYPIVWLECVHPGLSTLPKCSRVVRTPVELIETNLGKRKRPVETMCSCIHPNALQTQLISLNTRMERIVELCSEAQI